jgi:hypothetical protein
MRNDALRQRGATECFSKAGLAIGDGAKTGIGLAAPNGAGTDFAIDGIAYHKADVATNIPLPAGTVIAQNSKCLFLASVDSAGTVTFVQGEQKLTADLTAGKEVLHWPPQQADKCPIGAVKIATGAVTFTPGTTALDAASITATYYDFAGGMPDRPLTS